MADSKNWRTVREQRTLNETRVETYQRLMDAEQRIADSRAQRGVSQAEIAQALSVSQPSGSQAEPEDDVFLAALSRYVAALGGHLEVGRLELHAVFPDQTITLLWDGEPPEL
jgi:predicted XRE-type DNA-binding protein